jgi:hypothetical protein
VGESKKYQTIEFMFLALTIRWIGLLCPNFVFTKDPQSKDTHTHNPKSCTKKQNRNLTTMDTFFEDIEEWSEDEDVDGGPLTFDAAIQVKLGFGKHKRKSVGELVRTGAGRAYMIENFEKLFDTTKAAMQLALEAYAKAKIARS